jgi:hypothetical protein
MLCLLIELTFNNGPVDPHPATTLDSLGLAVFLLASLARRLERFAALAAVIVMALRFSQTWPTQPNHYGLFTLALFLLAVLDLEKEDEQALGLQAVRWLTVITLFFTGAQKLLYGTYFHGEFMAWKIAIDEHFAKPFRYLLTETEYSRLRALDGMRFGSGEYRPDSLILVVISNLVYVFELAVPVFLLLGKTRIPALVASVIFIFVVESAAREYFFGVGFVALLLTFASRDWIRYLIPIFLLCALYALAERYGLLPPG